MRREEGESASGFIRIWMPFSLNALVRLGLVMSVALAPLEGNAQLRESPKRQAIKELISLTARGDAAWDRVSDRFIHRARMANPAADPEVWRELQTYMRGVIAKASEAGGPTYQMSVRYEREFTYEEIQEILAFFKSEIGSKFATEMAAMLMEYEQANAAFLIRQFSRLERKLKPFFDQRGLKMPGGGE